MAPHGTEIGGRASVAGLVAVAAAAALWAVAAVVARRLFESGVDPIALAEARAVIAFAGFALVHHLRRRPFAPRRSWHLVALGIALALVNAAYYLAIDRIAVAVALVLQYTAPALIVGWAALAGRRRPSGDVLVALVTALVGVALVVEIGSGELGSLDMVGVAFALASAVLFAAYTLLSETAGAIHGSTGTMFRAFAVASLLWVLYQLPQGLPAELLEPQNVLPVLYVGVMGTLAPFLLFVWGVQRVRSERAAIAATLEPVLAAVIAWVWLEEALSPMQLVGAALVLAAVVSLQARRREPILPPEV